MIIPAITALKKQLRDASAQSLSKPQVFSVICEPFSGLLWLANNPQFERTWWADRDQKHTRAGLGIADSISGPFNDSLQTIGQKLAQKTAQNPKFYYRGGIRFPSRFPLSPEWHPFGYYRFTLPLIELVHTPEGCHINCNWFPKTHLTISEQVDWILNCLDRVNFDLKSISTLPAVMAKTETPTQVQWEAQVSQAQGQFHAKKMDKLVLARCSRFTFESSLDPFALLVRMTTPSPPGIFQYAFQVSPDETFLGVSPEQLFHRQGRQLATEAIAGTQSADQPIDNLCQNKAAMEEHHWVAVMIQNAIAPICETWGASLPKVIQLPKVSHLYQLFQATLKEGITDADLLTALFPTPAVAGYPVKAALEALQISAEFDRGWYSGVVGLWSQEEAQVVVAIRSALIQAETAYVYSGAGIVSDSIAEAEWQELNDKMRNYTDVFNRDV